MNEVKIDKSEIEKLKGFFQATNKELNAASNRTIKYVVNTWIVKEVVQDVSKQSGVQQKILRSRVRTSVNAGLKEGKFWFGTWRVSLARLTPKQTKKGVKAGTRGSIFREGAFLMKISKRNGESAAVPYQVMKRVGNKRLPIEKQLFKYENSTGRIEKNILPQVPDKVTEKMRQELNWEASKR